jgi:hypothetical protein
MNLADYTKLKADLEEKQRLVDQAEGALSQLESQLKKEFGIGFDELPETIARLEKEVKKEEKQFEEELIKWKETWGKKLELS